MTDFPRTADALDWAHAFAEHFTDYFKLLPETTDLHEWFAQCIEEGRQLGYVQAGLEANVEQGYIEQVGESDDGPIYKMTEAGKQRVANMLSGRD